MAGTSKVEFTGTLKAEGPGGAWIFLELPKDSAERLGTRGRVSVAGTINGFAFRTSAAPTGRGNHAIMVNKVMRAGAKAEGGARVRVSLTVDTKPREFRIPADVTKAVNASPAARTLWAKVTPRCREEWVQHVEEARKAQTRQRRIAAMVETLASGKRRKG